MVRAFHFSAMGSSVNCDVLVFNASLLVGFQLPGVLVGFIIGIAEQNGFAATVTHRLHFDGAGVGGNANHLRRTTSS